LSAAAGATIPLAPRKAIGWSIAFLASGVILSVVVFAALTAGLAPGDDLLVTALVQALAMLLAFGAMTWLIGLRGAGLTPASLRWAPAGVGIRGFVVGLLVAAVTAGLALGAGVFAGGADWSLDGGTPGHWLAVVGATGAVLLPAALAEEIVFRGVPLVLVAGVLGRWRAAVLLSVLFALAHLLNPGVTGLALLNIALPGVFLSACFYLPGGLWTATGAHLGWNLTLAALAAPVSGLPLAMPWIDYAPGGPDWVTGGSFGPEGGLLATLAFGIATVGVVRQVRLRRAA
jgi:membrane protease YdiL (CAAX protease family)